MFQIQLNSITQLLQAQPYRGVGQVDSEAPDDSHLIRHSYYQWVPLVLTMQTFLLYLPKWFWKQVCGQSKLFLYTYKII